MNLHPTDEQIDAETFVRDCRRESRMFPRPHIDEVVREQVRRVVSKDFIMGCSDGVHENGNYDVCLACGGDGGFDDTHIGTDHEVHSDYRECRECEGAGRVFHE